LIPSFTAILSEYHNKQTFTKYLSHHDLDVTIDTWLQHPEDDLQDGNSSEPTSAMLAKLTGLLQSFPQLQPNDVLQHLLALNPISFLALDNANDTLMCSQMLHAHDKQAFLDAEEQEINGLLDMHIWKYHKISTLPANTQLINSIWLYQQKCMVDGHLIKHKA